MAEFYARYEYASCLIRALALADVLFIIYVIWRAPETGDNLWLWLPVFILFPIIGMLAYILFRLKVRSDDRSWEREQLIADKYRGGYVSRRITSEKALREQYYRAKGRRNY